MNEYILFFETIGKQAKGFNKAMFTKQIRSMKGYQQFEDAQFNITKVKRGAGSMEYFSSKMSTDQYIGVNQFTNVKRNNLKLLTDTYKKRPELGGAAFDKLSPDDLILDMKERFWKGQIRSLFAYICLLEEHKNDRAMIKVQRDRLVFEACLNT